LGYEARLLIVDAALVVASPVPLPTDAVMVVGIIPKPQVVVVEVPVPATVEVTVLRMVLVNIVVLRDSGI